MGKVLFMKYVCGEKIDKLLVAFLKEKLNEKK